MAITDPRLLTLSFVDKKLEDVVLQYHPYELSLSEKSQSTTVAGLTNLITYVAPENTTDTTIKVGTYLTALVADKDNFNSSLTPVKEFQIATIAAGAVFVGAGALGKTALDIFDAAFSTISLVKGVYDVGSGLITPNVVSPSTIGLPDEQLKKVTIISEAINKSIPCTVYWDLSLDAYPLNRYIINSMDLSIKAVAEETGKSMILDMQLVLSKQGTRIEVT